MNKYRIRSVYVSPEKQKNIKKTEVLQAKTARLNKFPLSKVSHRAMVPIYISKPKKLSICEKQQRLRKIFSVANMDQRMLTAKILGFRDNAVDTIVENNDSFNDRYCPTKHKFSHKALGEVQLPRKYFTINKCERLFSFSTQDNFFTNDEGSKLLHKPIKNSAKFDLNTLKELRRKALTSIKHYKKLRIDPAIIHKLTEYLPGVPYGQAKSEEFLTACKEDNIELVIALLEANKWLVHVYDKSGQTGLHWAVKRKHINIARLLIQNGLWVDVTDYVIPIQIGRTSLFIAVKNEDTEMVAFLMSQKATPSIRTRAGSNMFEGLTDPTIRSLLIKKAKRHLDNLSINNN